VARGIFFKYNLNLRASAGVVELAGTLDLRRRSIAVGFFPAGGQSKPEAESLSTCRTGGHSKKVMRKGKIASGVDFFYTRHT